ncbi:general substrate transporter [Bisporella sp. PMI_857]|nr:general substrate transporter [Bisporella sp. PMI_857]
MGGATSSSAYNFLVVFTVALGSFTYGFNSSIIGSVFGLPGFFEYFDLTLGGKKSTPIIGAANGLFAGGGMIGCIAVAWMADRAGRVRAIQALCLLGIVSAIIQAASIHIAMFLVGRFLSGATAGMANAIVPVYQSEISTPKQRGRMVGSHGFLVVCGYASAAWTGYGCYFEKNLDIQWRLCLALQVVAPGLLMAATFWIPESPRWLIVQDHGEKALETLIRLHANPNDLNNTFANEEYIQICRQLELESRNPQGIINQLKEPHNRKRFLTGMFVQCLAQSTGVLVTSNYQILLWNNLGLFGSIPLLLYSLYTSWAAFLNWVSSMIVDRFGRRRLLIFGFVGCTCMLICFTAMVATFSETDNKVGNAFGVVFLFLFVTFYASCVDATSYVYCSEIFPTHMRAQGVAASIFGLFAMTLIYTQPAAEAFATIGWKYYLIFIIVPACGIPIITRLPETKGLSLEEIAATFGDEVALDLSHLSPEEKKKLDEQIRASTTGRDGKVLANINVLYQETKIETEVEHRDVA